MAVISFRNTLSVDPVFKAIITHFMFENTHPFNDGNGRFGRYLLASDLAQSLDELTGLSISTEISKNVRKYYKAFRETSRPSNRAEATLFVQDMLAIIIAAQLRQLAKVVEVLGVEPAVTEIKVVAAKNVPVVA